MRLPAWCYELRAFANGTSIIEAIKQAVREKRISWEEVKEADGKPGWILNAAIDVPDALRRAIASQLQDESRVHIEREWKDLQCSGFSIPQLQRMLHGLRDYHPDMRVSEWLSAVRRNPYLIGQVVLPEELLRVDTIHGKNPDRDTDRMRGFLASVLSGHWQAGRAYLNDNSPTLTQTARYLAQNGRFDDKFYRNAIKEQLKELCSDELSFAYRLRLNKLPDGSISFMPAVIYHSEWQAAECLVQLVYTPTVQLPDGWYDWLANTLLSSEQRTALTRIWKQPITLLTGGPGTGKTTIMRTLREAVERFEPTAHMLGMAPTGKAAQQLQRVSGIDSDTIHKKLAMWREHSVVQRAALDDQSGTAFTVCDESSMLSMRLARALLWAMPVKRGWRLVLVGDDRQLPPVGIGQPFQQMCEEEAMQPFRVTLRDIHRSNGSLADAATLYQNRDALWVWNNSVRAVREMSPETMQRRIKEWIESHGGIEDASWQIVCPYRHETDSHAFGTEDICAWLGRDVLAPGVRVVQTENNATTNRKNGESAIISEMDGRWATADFGGERFTLPLSEAYVQWVPAYAITIHRAQGSEWPHVLVVVPPDASYADRRGLYTALTRARTSVTIMAADPDVLVEACRTSTRKLPYSGFIKKFRSLRVKGELPAARQTEAKVDSGLEAWAMSTVAQSETKEGITA